MDSFIHGNTIKYAKGSVVKGVVEAKKAKNEEKIDGVFPSELKKQYNNNTVIGNMIRYLYKQTGPILVVELQKAVNYENFDKFRHNIDTGRSENCYNGRLWSYNASMIELNPKIREIINNF